MQLKSFFVKGWNVVMWRGEAAWGKECLEKY
jgi:hypothetical protein